MARAAILVVGGKKHEAREPTANSRRNIKGRPLWSRFECSLNRSRGGTPL